MVKYVEGSWDEDYIQTLGKSNLYPLFNHHAVLVSLGGLTLAGVLLLQLGNTSRTLWATGEYVEGSWDEDYIQTLGKSNLYPLSRYVLSD
jgi:hypothetical protein